MKKPSAFSLAMSFVSLMMFWIIMSGYLDAIHLSMGVFSVILAMAMNYKMKSHRFFEDDMNDLKDLRFGHAVFYFFWMILQIVKSAVHVAKVIMSPSMPTNLAMIQFRVNLPNSHAKMILGNSITLTPGTVTVSIEGDIFTVHGLDNNSFEGILSDEMPHQVLRLFNNDVHPVVSDVKYLS
jgi:multicomponent Na+:H+ antiporter subunit E